MSALNMPLSTNAHDDRVVGVLLHRDDALLLTLAGGRRGVLQRALSRILKWLTSSSSPQQGPYKRRCRIFTSTFDRRLQRKT
jgi:hypothetical protein